MLLVSETRKLQERTIILTILKAAVQIKRIYSFTGHYFFALDILQEDICNHNIGSVQYTTEQREIIEQV